MPEGQQLLELLSSFGAAGVLAMWTRWLMEQLRIEKDAHERTRDKLDDVLMRQAQLVQHFSETETRRTPRIPEEERRAWLAKYGRDEDAGSD